ncbi:helix-turn-helix transcriptional regulator [Roseovarius sp. EGI FJ00037]|uniref:helix-turn-helix domain-containing protein n=1 Tax=Roseovarius salincola TaxID=2978479 RepID=UPI0022A88FC1|nr:helix-turn-helix transcriptional regulator [Roseovarius sp. EGI FJ00037]MCZ0814244.1 helix-turn-helix transcriptional regulator [Roseovarius sp. EGI FJ00037]
MSPSSMTFGQAISTARKSLGLSQKMLAGLVMKEEGGGSISPQYLNDIEHDRRSPSSGHLIRQFSSIVNLPEDYLFALAGRLPDDLRLNATDPEKVVKAFADLRRALKQ